MVFALIVGLALVLLAVATWFVFKAAYAKIPGASLRADLEFMYWEVYFALADVWNAVACRLFGHAWEACEVPLGTGEVCPGRLCQRCLTHSR